MEGKRDTSIRVVRGWNHDPIQITQTPAPGCIWPIGAKVKLRLRDRTWSRGGEGVVIGYNAGDVLRPREWYPVVVKWARDEYVAAYHPSALTLDIS